jgi:hypothetical protein
MQKVNIDNHLNMEGVIGWVVTASPTCPKQDNILKYRALDSYFVKKIATRL